MWIIDVRRRSGHSMFVQMETTPNDDSLKFIPGLGIVGAGVAEFRASRTALE
ncbi:hypothetical protein DFJ58DRAFT_648188 [Suillus subalutaceus]|uniref:uncharacterized protein n=1 Tax=Suillus subalutaceus TaxID=48586 RepID=UPI001B880154|nr:uncharacterized protein DFJ58DRAFT_648188 [Suillus subalutaceus]KAG1877948.1 hypothetical protein DFJ58DRAFT_648188 [Suillus subalutaceus]